MTWSTVSRALLKFTIRQLSMGSERASQCLTINFSAILERTGATEMGRGLSESNFKDHYGDVVI